MANSILDAIKHGIWDYEPVEQSVDPQFASTEAVPGTVQKLDILAERVRRGLPLWHPRDRSSYRERDE